MKQFAVFGNPIAHSQSPAIHHAFARQFDIDLLYRKILVSEGKFAAFASSFFERGAGANVTVPFKGDALQFADKLSNDAKLAGAVNTLTRRHGMIVGDNTDGVGLVRDIRDNHKQIFRAKNLLIIGAGGASRGVILPIARQHPQSITLVNRTPEKAMQLAKWFLPYVAIKPCTFAELNTPFDIIINATSSSLSGQPLPLCRNVVGDNTFAYDMMYAAQPTAFMQFAEKHGAKVADGLGMLVEQAAESFEIWHAIKPQTREVIAMIRAEL